MLNPHNPRWIPPGDFDQRCLWGIVLGCLSTQSRLRLLLFHFSQVNSFQPLEFNTHANILQRRALVLPSCILWLTELHAKLPSLWIRAKELFEMNKECSSCYFFLLNFHANIQKLVPLLFISVLCFTKFMLLQPNCVFQPQKKLCWEWKLFQKKVQ